MIRALCIVVAVFAWAASAVAGNSLGRSEFNAFLDLATGATKHAVNMGGSGNPLVTSGAGGTSGVGNMNFSHTAGGWPTVTGTAKMPSPISGKGVNLTVKQALARQATAKAMSKFAFGVAGPMLAGMAIFEVLDDIGVVCTWSPTLSRQDCKQTTQQEYTASTRGYVAPYIQSTCEAAVLQHWGGVGATYFVEDNSFRLYTKKVASARCVQVGANFSGYLTTSRTCIQRGGLCNGTYAATSGEEGSPITVLTRVIAVDIPLTEESLAARIAAESGWPSTSDIDKLLPQIVNAGIPLETEGVPELVPDVTRVVSDPKTTTNSDGSTKTETTTCDLVVPFGLGTAEWVCFATTTASTPAKVDTKTVITTNPDGTTSTQTVTTTTPSTTATSTTTGVTTAEQDKTQSCGLPNTPACRIDESQVSKTTTLALDEAAVTSQAEKNRTTISGTADKGMLSGWSSLFVTPPVVACAPLQMPASVGGVTVDPCPVVDGVRSIMAWLWALAGFWCCLGWIREAI